MRLKVKHYYPNWGNVASVQKFVSVIDIPNETYKDSYGFFPNHAKRSRAWRRKWEGQLITVISGEHKGMSIYV